MLAALWNRPQATFASKIELAETTAKVTREVDAGLETLEVDLPAVITTDLRLNEPRFVKLPEIMKAKTKPLDVHSAGRSSAAPARRASRCTKTEPPPGRQRGIMVKDAAELFAELHKRGLRMSKVLIVAEHADGKLNASTAKCVKAAAALAGAEIVGRGVRRAGLAGRRAGRAARGRRARHRGGACRATSMRSPRRSRRRSPSSASRSRTCSAPRPRSART